MKSGRRLLKFAPAILAGAILLAAAGWPAGARAACQLNSPSGKIKHVVYVEFDNVHFTRDNPNVPSDLEQMPNLLNFIEQNGTLDAGDHTVLISHTANDILTTQTGLYSDDTGIFIANNFLEFEPGSPANIFTVSSFFYWTDSVADIVSGTNDNTPALTTPSGKNVPAPWVPFTRAGCDVGAFSTANIVLERTPFDVDQVFGGPLSPQGKETTSTSTKPNQTDDFIGAAIHCANGSSFCTAAASNPNVVEVADSLPDEPGGYSGYEALFGLKYILPALGGLTDYNGNAITGFQQLNFDPTPAQTLAVVETMLKKGIPVVFAYIADAHDNQEGAGLSAEKTFGPGEAPYVKQLSDYNTAFGTFFANLKADGIDESNTLFIFTPDEGDHFVGGAPSPANCDGVNTPCTYPPNGANPGVGELDLDLNALVAETNATPFTYHFDDAATTFVPGQPGPTDPSVRALEQTMAGLSAVNKHTGMNESLLGTNLGPALQGALVDPVAQKLLHMDTQADLNASGVSVREPTFTFFGNPNFFFEAAKGVSATPTVGTGFAWNHGDIQPEIARTFIGIVGPGVQNLGVTQPTDFFTDHVDVRPTLMFLTGLTDDYEHDGRVILELIDHHILPSSLHPDSDPLLPLGQIYKQIDAPFGECAESTLTVSTYALTSNSPGDTTYTNLENQIASWTTERDGLTAQIKSMLEGAEFNGEHINKQQAEQIICEGQALLNQASICASDPATCGAVPSCTTTYTGTINHDLNVSSGLTCIIDGTVTGNVTQSGGELFASNACIEGNMQISGGSTFSIGGTTVLGNVQIQNLSAGPANQICGTSMSSNVQVQNNESAIAIGGASCPGNTIANDLQVHDNGGGIQISNDTIGGNLQCQNNSPITGSLDTAKSLQGQCAGF